MITQEKVVGPAFLSLSGGVRRELGTDSPPGRLRLAHRAQAPPAERPDTISISLRRGARGDVNEKPSCRGPMRLGFDVSPVSGRPCAPERQPQPPGTGLGAADATEQGPVS